MSEVSVFQAAKLLQRADYYRSHDMLPLEAACLRLYLKHHTRDEAVWVRYLKTEAQKPIDAGATACFLAAEFPHNPFFHILISKAHLEEGKYELAIGHADMASKLEPLNGENWLAVAAVWEKIAKLDGGTCDRGLWEIIIRALEKALLANPNVAESWLRLGTAYRMLDDFSHALECYGMALYHSPKCPGSPQEKAQMVKTLEGMGITLLLSGNGDFEKIFRQVLELDPDNLVAKGHLDCQ